MTKLQPALSSPAGLRPEDQRARQEGPEGVAEGARARRPRRKGHQEVAMCSAGRGFGGLAAPRPRLSGGSGPRRTGPGSSAARTAAFLSVGRRPGEPRGAASENRGPERTRAEDATDDAAPACDYLRRARGPGP